MIPQAAPINRRARTRQSSDSAWPLRRADGTPFYAAPAVNPAPRTGEGAGKGRG